ncbi:MAG: hypothetical protein HXY20_10120 [Acidobacteria bacterium]|nr:hypothetical protein [Acidobacteriota bacterium]
MMALVKLVPQRKSVVVSYPIKAVSTTWYSREAVQAYIQKPHDPTCNNHPELVEEAQHEMGILGTGSFHGVSVVKHVRETEEAIIETWESPECSCEAVLTRATWRNPDGTVQGTTEQIATAIHLGEPDPSLFEIPADFAEKPPSVVANETSRKVHNRDFPSDSLRKLGSADKAYRDSQAHRPNN